jgi:hypothetical protein
MLKTTIKKAEINVEKIRLLLADGRYEACCRRCIFGAFGRKAKYP